MQGTRVILELGSAEPVEGFLVADGGRPRPFTGWMDLVAALQAVIDEAAIPREVARKRSGEQ